MRRFIGFSAWLGAAMAVAIPVSAQPSQPAPPPVPTATSGMTMPEYQGWACLLGGITGATGVFVYSDVIAVAATGVVNPALLIPVMATGFAVGCSVSATASPALLWFGHTASGR